MTTGCRWRQSISSSSFTGGPVDNNGYQPCPCLVLRALQLLDGLTLDVWMGLHRLVYDHSNSAGVQYAQSRLFTPFVIDGRRLQRTELTPRERASRRREMSWRYSIGPLCPSHTLLCRCADAQLFTALTLVAVLCQCNDLIYPIAPSLPPQPKAQRVFFPALEKAPF